MPNGSEARVAPVTPVLHWSETLFPAVASTPITFTDRDGLPNEGTVGIMIDLAQGVGGLDVADVERILVQSGAGQWDIDMVNYRRWVNRFTRGKYILAGADRVLPIIFYFPDMPPIPSRYSSQLPAGSFQVTLRLGAAVPADSALRVAMYQVRGVARRWTPLLQSSTYTMAATGRNRIPLEADGFLRGVSVPNPAAVTRLEVWNKLALGEAYRDGTPLQLRLTEELEGGIVTPAASVVSDGFFCNLDTDADVLGLAPATAAASCLYVEQTAGAVSFEVARYSVVPA